MQRFSLKLCSLFLAGCFWLNAGIADSARSFEDGFVKKFVTLEERNEAFNIIDNYSFAIKGCSRGNPDPCAADFIYLPTSLGKVILSYIDQAYARGYYQHLSVEDFYHGHLVSRHNGAPFGSIEEYFADLDLILFHSREHLGGWKEIPKDENAHTPSVPHTPRSFLGFLNSDLEGEISPAIDHMPSDFGSNIYRGFGTIFDIELTDANPGLSEVPRHTGSSVAIHTSGDGSGKACTTNEQVYLIPDSNGRFLAADGTRIEMFIQCEYR